MTAGPSPTIPTAVADCQASSGDQRAGQGDGAVHRPSRAAAPRKAQIAAPPPMPTTARTQSSATGVSGCIGRTAVTRHSPPLTA